MMTKLFSLILTASFLFSTVDCAKRPNQGYLKEPTPKKTRSIFEQNIKLPQNQDSINLVGKSQNTSDGHDEDVASQSEPEDDIDALPDTQENTKVVVRSGKPFACTWQGCDNAFTRKSHLITHMRTHTGEKPFNCTHDGCDGAFTTRSNLTTHMRTHTGEKPFKCTHDGCDRAFTQQIDLTRHIITHTREKPYKCTHDGCDDAFPQQGTLTKHMRTHTGERPYKCIHNGCDKSFTQQGTLTKHLLS